MIVIQGVQKMKLNLWRTGGGGGGIVENGSLVVDWCNHTDFEHHCPEGALCVGGLRNLMFVCPSASVRPSSVRPAKSALLRGGYEGVTGLLYLCMNLPKMT